MTDDDRGPSEPPSERADPRAQREARLAEQLRANLRRRKAAAAPPSAATPPKAR